jgi:hypothetical protein
MTYDQLKGLTVTEGDSFIAGPFLKMRFLRCVSAHASGCRPVGLANDGMSLGGRCSK